MEDLCNGTDLIFYFNLRSNTFPGRYITGNNVDIKLICNFLSISSSGEGETG